jgi:hypothetical protein
MAVAFYYLFTECIYDCQGTATWNTQIEFLVQGLSLASIRYENARLYPLFLNRSVMTCPYPPIINASVTHYMPLFVYCSYTNHIITTTASYLSLRIHNSDMTGPYLYSTTTSVGYDVHICLLWHQSDMTRPYLSITAITTQVRQDVTIVPVIATSNGRVIQPHYEFRKFVTHQNFTTSCVATQWVPGLSRGWSGRGVALTTPTHLGSRLRKE